MGEGKNARDRDVVVICISRNQWTTEIRERKREILAGKNEADGTLFPHKFNAQHTHT